MPHKTAATIEKRPAGERGGHVYVLGSDLARDTTREVRVSKRKVDAIREIAMERIDLLRRLAKR